MYLYVCLILLPATALAACDSKYLTIFFESLDKNKDNAVQRTEADAFYKELNTDGDDCLTLAEVKKRAPTVAPGLEGHEEEPYNMVDVDHNGCITVSDTDAVYMIMDTDKDGAISKSEYNIFLNVYCVLGFGRIL